jgi:hypothetical protein
MKTIEPRSLLGLPAYLDQDQITKLIAELTQLWDVTVGVPPRELEDDLAVTRQWFDPVAQGQRLRRELAELPDIPQMWQDPGPPMTLFISATKRLMTPEGRCVLELLNQLPAARTGHAIGEMDLAPYERRLAILYRDWSRHRLQSVIDLLAGTTKPLQIAAGGVVIALLVNRCTSEDRALTRFAAGSTRDVVDAAFFAAVSAFADTLAPRRRGNPENAKLVSGWMLYEARRRLGDGLVVIDARAGVDGKVWIQSRAVDHVVDVVARDLARGHRVRVTSESLAIAFDALVIALRSELQGLASFGLAHERPLDTQRLRQRLVDSLEKHLAEP